MSNINNGCSIQQWKYLQIAISQTFIENLYTLTDNGNKILISYDMFLNSIKSDSNLINHDIAITAIHSIFTIRIKSDALKGRIISLGISIDRNNNNANNTQMISFNIDALNNENWPIWIGDVVTQLPSSTPTDRTRVRRRSSTTPDDELQPRTRVAASPQQLPLNVSKLFIVYLF